MGLKNTIELKGGVTLTDSYLKIGKISISSDGLLGYDLLAYLNKETRDASVKDTLNHNITEYVDMSYFNSDIKPIVDQLKAKIYEHAKANGYSNFSDL